MKRRSGSEEMSSARCTHARAHRTHTLHGCRQRSKHRCLHTAVVCTAGRGEGAAGEPPPAASGRLLYAAATGRSRQKSHSESGCQIPWHLKGVLAPCFYTCTAIDFFVGSQHSLRTH